MATPIIDDPELSAAYEKGFADGREAQREIAATEHTKCPHNCIGYQRIGTCKHLHPEWDLPQTIC